VPFDFPSNPMPGQVFIAGGAGYTWSGYAWLMGGRPGVLISDTSPAFPRPGQLWWESDTGAFYIYYDDGDSAAWVQLNGALGESTPAPDDTTPRAFYFADVTNATVSTVYTSNEITVSGIGMASPISILGGTYSINGGPYTAAAGTVVAWDTVTVRVTSSASDATMVNAILTIGGVSDTYTVTTTAPDTTPDAFSLMDVTAATLSTVYTSNAIIVAGINTAAPISITGGTYAINGGTYTATAGTVVAGDSVTVRVTSAASNSAAVNATLTIGGVSDTYTVTTVAAAGDTTPDAFSFTDVTAAALSTVYTSNTITVAGINVPTAISITGGTYSINGGAYTATAGTVSAGDTVTVRVTSAAANSAAINAALTIGGVIDTYTVTTAAAGGADTTPDAFSFTDVPNATASTVYTSNAITVAGINTAAAISITGGTYSINGGAYTPAAGTVVAGDSVTVRVTSSPTSATAINAVLTIGGVTDTYTVTTGVAAPVNKGAPVITGTPTQGQTLTVSNGTWTNSPTSYAYQWFKAVEIPGATAATYLLVLGDVNAIVHCKVTATNAGGSATEPSDPVGPIGGAVGQL